MEFNWSAVVFDCHGRFVRVCRELLEGDHFSTDVQYNYETEWRDKLVDSSRFVEPEGHENPK